jgi:tetratricopeptide (TPR) repeat protein
MVLNRMAKPGRNDPCPCGSGNKYKKCCMPKHEAAEREGLAEAQARRQSHVRELKAQVAARLRMAEEEDTYEDELDAASNAVVHLVKAGKLDEAEAAARDLLVRYPEVHDGWDRLGMVHEARGNTREAADCYRKVIEFICQHPENFDAGLADEFAKLATKLDPPALS